MSPRPKEVEYSLSTEQVAAIAQVKPTTVRSAVCRTGSYFGLTAKRLPNGRLSWPSDARDRLLEAGQRREERDAVAA